MSRFLKNSLLAALSAGLMWAGSARAAYIYEIYVAGQQGVSAIIVNPGDVLSLQFKITNNDVTNLTVLDPIWSDPFAGIFNNLVGATGTTDFDDISALLAALPIDGTGVLANGGFVEDIALGTLSVDALAVGGSTFQLFSTLVPDNFNGLGTTVLMDFTVRQQAPGPGGGNISEPATLPMVAFALGAAAFLARRKGQ